MSTPSNGKVLPIGIDLGSQTLKVAQLQVEDGATELIASGCAEVPNVSGTLTGAQLNSWSKALRRILKSGGFRGKRCILSIPADLTLVHHVKVPKGTHDQILQAIRQDLQNQLPYPVDEAVLRYVVAGEAFGDGDPQQEAIAVSAKRSDVEAIARMIRRLKLDIRAINIEPCAIVECFARLFRRASDSSRTILYIDMGAETTQVVFSQGARIVFARNLPVGGSTFEKTAAESLEVPHDEVRALRLDLLAGREAKVAPDVLYAAFEQPLVSFGEELLQCLRYYESVFRNQAIERAIFVGGQAYDRRLCQMIARRLNLPAQIGDPLVRIHRAEGSMLTSTDPLPNWAVAVGLSLGAEEAA